MNVIEVKDLNKTYYTYERKNSFLDTVKSLFVRKTIEIKALNNISFSVEKGELLGFLGPNGAGKSTTLKILTGILLPTSGTASVMGFTPWRQRKSYVSNIGAVFGQKSQLIWDIPPMDSFEMNRAIYSIDRSAFKEKLNTMIDILDISKVIYKPTRQLSLGERMKCEFIMSMLHSPKIVFLDEPTIGLDVVAKDKIRDFITEMNKKGTTFILTTHDLGDVERLAQRVIVINNGEIAFDDSINSLKMISGSKKTVKVTTNEPLTNFREAEGINLVSLQTETEAELEIDTSYINLSDFIKLVNEGYIIKDITISDPPIESVIKKLYSSV